MARPRIFVDGHVGTTGLRIREWLAPRRDLELLEPDEAQRKDAGVRRDLANRADVVVLCLPDDAAREAAGWIENEETRVVDASTAHRVEPGWVYGLPEISAAQREAVSSAKRLSNPGCYPTSVILGLRPLVEEGLLPSSAPVTVHALSGYTGGGRGLIERWEDPALGLAHLPHEAPYALERSHKHVPEMVQYTGLASSPQFVPAVGPFRCGMRVEMPLHASVLANGASGKRIHELLRERYDGTRFVRVAPLREPLATDERSFDPQACNDTNRVELHVLPHPDGHVLLIGLLDNLGKGASGAAIQSMNLMLGLDESEGLRA
ncbi:MAG: N-acetyl-gamma-glutamyl-phosphate reductase [Deltaproteobacteria bacterium]|nr:N-acetyl-gamma-glutamyl-phosphate reductase [Deltaproteobacteria bacterium]